MSSEVVKLPWEIVWPFWKGFLLVSLVYFISSILLKSKVIGNMQHMLKVVFITIAICMIVFFNYDDKHVSWEIPQGVTLLQVVLVPILFFDLLISIIELLSPLFSHRHKNRP